MYKHSFQSHKSNTVKSFIFVGLLILCISWEGEYIWIQDPNEILLHLSNIAYNLKSAYLSVHEHVQCCQSTKFRAHEMKWFHSKRSPTYRLIAVWWSAVWLLAPSLDNFLVCQRETRKNLGRKIERAKTGLALTGIFCHLFC